MNEQFYKFMGTLTLSLYIIVKLRERERHRVDQGKKKEQ